MKDKLIHFSFILLSTVLLTACGPKQTTAPNKPTPTPRLIEIPVNERPIINLTPRDDGHMLFLKLTNVADSISSIEYEVIYTAKDGNMEIEKGLGDTIKDISPTIERKLLLGTESCTNGCKYKYDEGVGGGTISLKFSNKSGQISTYESSFSLKTAAELRKTKLFQLLTDDFKITIDNKLTGNDYFILLKQYRGGYSVFSNGHNPLVGDYPRP